MTKNGGYLDNAKASWVSSCDLFEPWFSFPLALAHQLGLPLLFFYQDLYDHVELVSF